jgi:hypothetical protein
VIEWVEIDVEWRSDRRRTAPAGADHFAVRVASTIAHPDRSAYGRRVERDLHDGTTLRSGGSSL